MTFSQHRRRMETDRQQRGEWQRQLEVRYTAGRRLRRMPLCIFLTLLCMCCFYLLVFTSARSSRGDACLRWDWSVPLGRPHVSYVRYCFLLFLLLFFVVFLLSAVGLEPSSKAASSVSGRSLINILRRSSCHTAHCLPRRFLAPRCLRTCYFVPVHAPLSPVSPPPGRW